MRWPVAKTWKIISEDSENKIRSLTCHLSHVIRKWNGKNAFRFRVHKLFTDKYAYKWLSSFVLVKFNVAIENRIKASLHWNACEERHFRFVLFPSILFSRWLHSEVIRSNTLKLFCRRSFWGTIDQLNDQRSRALDWFVNRSWFQLKIIYWVSSRRSITEWPHCN